MRRIIVGAFISLDGVMQAPGGPEEDPSGGFTHGGWGTQHWDDTLNTAIGELFGRAFDLLLGRRTYDIFAAHWPFVQKDPAAADYDAGAAEMGESFDRIDKFVLTHRPESLDWVNSHGLATVEDIRALKNSEGRDLVVQGSTELNQLLFQHGLVDELWVLTFPLLLGGGKRLFDDGIAAASLKMVSSRVSDSGVVVAVYEPKGEVVTGSFAMAEPSAAELERRKNLG
ncbi:dihydrofolate reductase family protein [Caulobacter segnis]|uniref:dihydrofolate reductase family protein n=1 Tax=Caulobacter segnis TaxID=88688 RepID=UPI00240FDD77|nr:dihydrofolate reductase family protein [Caulobacter segnis]MDG2523320.1 dihydrofolate reductase family protein [Caulobacter segnis]